MGGEGGLINYRGTMAGICVEEEKGLRHVLREIDLPHVLREIDRHPCICVGEVKVWERDRARVLERVVVELLLTNGGIGLLEKRRARPQYQLERRWLLVCACACERRVRRHA